MLWAFQTLVILINGLKGLTRPTRARWGKVHQTFIYTKRGRGASKEGKMRRISVRKLNFVPSFSGRHNRIKLKVWLTLHDAYQAGKQGLTLRELVNMTGCDYKSLSTLLSRWVKWGYVGYQEQKFGRKYHLLKRGRAWLDRWSGFMPVNRYLRD